MGKKRFLLRYGWLLMALLLGAGALLPVGCRSAGATGYVELNEQETGDLISRGRAVLLNAKRRIKKTGKLVPVLHSQAVLDYVRTETPQYLVEYQGDLAGRFLCQWEYDNWTYRVEATGELTRDIENLQWRFSVKPPLALNGCELWEGPDPDEIADYFDRLNAGPNDTSAAPKKRVKLEYDDNELPSPPMRDIQIEGAVEQPAK